MAPVLEHARYAPRSAHSGRVGPDQSVGGRSPAREPFVLLCRRYGLREYANRDVRPLSLAFGACGQAGAIQWPSTCGAVVTVLAGADAKATYYLPKCLTALPAQDQLCSGGGFTGWEAKSPQGARRGTGRGTSSREFSVESVLPALSAGLFVQAAAVQRGRVPLVMRRVEL